MNTPTSPDAARSRSKHTNLEGTLRPTAELVHYAHADDLPYQIMADNYDRLSELIGKYMSEADREKAERAYCFAAEKHRDQKRRSGELYINHPVEVAIILAELKMDCDVVCAALLHDTVEDTETSLADVAGIFGETVGELVDGVTKLTNIEVDSMDEKQALNLRKMFLAMSRDIRVVIVKLADRLHNMRTLAALREDRRLFKARETMDVYAPLADRLGMSSIKWELEDLSFFYLEPEAYQRIARMVAESREARERYLAETIKTLDEELRRVGLTGFSIKGRSKHYWSIHQKMRRKGKEFSEIYDLVALRVITNTVGDCYSALGAVHTLWHPMPGRFKDYIAMPKFNMYQSLHTTVMGPAGRPLEVQIRTEEMHRASEYGVAAHWRYKESGGKVSASALDQQLAWLREMVDWQDETEDSREFLKSLKMDLDESEVFVFTPKGEVMSLRAGATPVDFAYAIHTEVGNHCVGAKVNGSIVPLSYRLQVGDRVEILTQKSASPSRDWLTMVKTPSARSKIRSYFSKVSRSDDLQLGRDKLTREMRKHGLGISSAQSMRAIKSVADAMGFNDPDDMFVQLGTGKESAQHVANRLLKILVDKGTAEAEKPDLGVSASSTGIMAPMLTSVKRPKRHETHAANGIVVKGVDDVLVRLSKCCNPVPGDEILGFVTRGRGVSVHRADCPNAIELKKEPERIIDVSWEGTPSASSYQVEVYIEGVDRTNLLLDVTRVFSETGTNVLSCSTNTHRDGMVEMRFLFQVSDLAAIDRLIKSLAELEGVFDAHRMVPGQALRKR